MAKINVLSFEIANLIAAGEVVERPASVLKELLENSIDSGASSIIAEIKRGGVALIRVTDNGCGIEKEDLPVAIQRHATSKIKEREDLDSIMTLGFRGEALAAISSVSNMTIISKTKYAEEATMLTAEGGRVVDISEVGASDGTTVVVENLFANVPARRKFLKKDATEAQNVAALVEKVAVSHPEIAIQLLIDGEERFKTPGDGDLYNTIYAIFGREFAKKLIKADGTANGVRVYGYIGRSDNVKKNRNLQNFFINGRYVKSLTAMAAIEKAYTSYIAPECFPTCVLFLEINPLFVDVNVHPAKLEVKFTDERAVFETVYYTVKTALEDHEYRPELELGTKKQTDRNPLGAFVPLGADTKGEQIKISVPQVSQIQNTPISRIADSGNSNIGIDSIKNKPTEEKRSYSEAVYKEETRSYSEPIHKEEKVSFSSGAFASVENSFLRKPTSPIYSEMSPKESVELLERYKNVTVTNRVQPSKSIEIIEEPVPSHKIIGEAFDCYVLVEYEGALLMIDKHAAHERIIFEELKSKNKNDGRVSSQKLLLPITILPSAPEIAVASDFAEDIKSIGFDFHVSDRSIDILAIPDAISQNDSETLFVNILSELLLGSGNPQLTEEIRREKALYQIACKAAIKGGRIYNSAIIDWLVKKVLMLPDITVCPHGRPIAYKLTKNELDRQFERIK